MCRQPRLYVTSNGQGCPCLDLSRLPRELCQAARTADLVILEGMGRAVLTNYQARFSVAALKVLLGWYMVMGNCDPCMGAADLAHHQACHRVAACKMPLGQWGH